LFQRRYACAIVVDERRTPTEVSHRFAEAINAGDLQEALTCWSPAGVLVEAEGHHVRGQSQLAERFQGLITIGAQLKISVSDEVCTKDGAMARTEMQMTIPGDGRETVVEIKGVVLYVPGPGGLQILIDRLAARSIAETP
jgi:ketosteroid isomerase-like protein